MSAAPQTPCLECGTMISFQYGSYTPSYCSKCALNVLKSTGTQPIQSSGQLGVDKERSTIIFHEYINDLEYLGDLLAQGTIDAEKYYKLKHMLKASDPETRLLARNIINKRVKIDDL